MVKPSVGDHRDVMLRSELLILPMPPSANRYWRHVGGRVYVSKEARDYRDLVAVIGAGADVTLRTWEVRVNVTVRRVHKRGDIDNYLKVLFDALQGVLWDDDKRIKEMTVKVIDVSKRKRSEMLFIDASGANGEVLVEVEDMEQEGKL